METLGCFFGLSANLQMDHWIHLEGLIETLHSLVGVRNFEAHLRLMVYLY